MNSKLLTKSLKKLGLITPVAVAAGIVSSAAFGFSPIGEPFDGDSFVSVGVSATASEVGNLVGSKFPADISFGKNLFNEGGIVAGVFGNVNLAGTATDASGIEKHEGSIGAFVAHKADSGLKLGLAVSYVRDISSFLPEKDASGNEIPVPKDASGEELPAPSAIQVQAVQSFGFEVAQVAGSPVIFTQAAEIDATKSLAKVEDKASTGVAIDGIVDLALSTTFGRFTPSFGVEFAKAFGKFGEKDKAGAKVDRKGKDMATIIFHSVDVALADFASLSVSLAKELGDEGQFGADVGVNFLF